MTRNASKSRRLTETEQAMGRHIVESVRHLISKATKKDFALAWAMRRYVYTRLIHDEKGTPMQRRFLKMKKMILQKGLCAICRKNLPKKGAELDRHTAMLGYTEKNTRLVHHQSYREGQEGKR